MYPGPGQNFSKQKCAEISCDENTAVYTREQIGSAFKPYVLAAAVKQGMNVQTSTLDGYSPLWIPPETADPAIYASLSAATAAPESFQVKNDSNENLGPLTVQRAIALSSNTAFTDLIHKVGTRNVVNLAAQMGVDTGATTSGLSNDIGKVGMALGENSLSVNEQTTLMSTLADNGTYHSAHVIQQITQGTTMTTAKVTQTQILTPAQNSQVDYAMEADTVNGGTGTAAAMTDGRQIIAKTGTTNTSQSVFFEGAIPQYSLAVGIFSNDQTGDNKETLTTLGGTLAGGFGGTWPAMIWHTFMEAEFAQTAPQQFPTPLFSGLAWNMVPANELPKAKTNKNQNQNQNQNNNGNGNGNGNNQGNPITNGALTATPTATAGFPTPTPTANGTTTGGLAVSAVKVGASAGGVLMVLPRTWLVSRRRRRKRKRS
jgi:membrane peptidoglycan carboxypeptidase